MVTIVPMLVQCRQERLKTEKLLSSLLPPAILKQMKNGEVPEPEVGNIAKIILKLAVVI